MGDIRNNLRMALQHVVICGPDPVVEKAILDTDAAVAELIEFKKLAIQEFNYLCNERRELPYEDRSRWAALAHVGDTK